MPVPARFILFIFTGMLFSAASYANNSIQMKQYEIWLKDQQFLSIVNAINKLDAKSLSPKHHSIYINASLNIDLDDAEDAAQRAISAFPDNPDLYLMHANVMGAQAQDSIFSALSYAEKALNSFKRAAELAPNVAKYHLGLMSFYLAAPSIAGGDTELALEQAQIIAQLDERKGIIALSRYYYTVEESDMAFSIINNGIAKFADDSLLYNHLAGLYTREEKYQQAIETYLKTSSFEVPALPLGDIDNSDIVEEYKSAQNRKLNSHYQIGRLALISQTNIELGIQHISTFLNLLETTDFDTTSLPSKEWAKLRIAGLQFSNNQFSDAKLTLAAVTLNTDDDNMTSVYKKLAKRIKKQSNKH